MEVAEEAIFPTAEGEKRHGGGDANVDADVTGGGFVAELAGSGTAAGKQAGHVAPGTAGSRADGFVNGVDLH
jgi:hypothetical protein